MNKTLIWLGVLVVVIVVVVFFAKGGESAATKAQRAAPNQPGVVPQMPIARGHEEYTTLVTRLNQATDAEARGYMFQDAYRWYIYGTGKVVRAESEQDGGWYVEFDMDPEKGDGMDVDVTVQASDVAGRPLPTVGEDYRFRGRLDKVTGEGDSMVVDLIRGQVSK
jgi:hypothetical protein